MELPLAVVAPGRARADVQVRADERATVGHVASLLGAAVAGSPGEPLFVDGHALDPNLPLPRQLSPYLLFMAASPIMVIGTTIGDRRNGHKDHRKAMAAYRAQMADVDRLLADLVRADEHSSRDRIPDPAAVVAAASGPTARLWERRPEDPDFLRLRVGLADRPADVRIRAGRRAATPAPLTPGDGTVEAPPARLVPVRVDLAADGVVGIAGPRPAALGLARAVVAQLATLHGPGSST